MKRRLAAILAADLVGYSRLMRADDEGTLSRLKECRAKTIEPLINEFDGRLVKQMGDGFLLEFPSVTAALSMARAWLKATGTASSQRAEDNPLQFRMGLHLGEVIDDGDDLYGDGVNVAARLEALAEPQAICVSEDATRHLRGDVVAQLSDLGPQVLKNIDNDFRVFQLSDSLEQATGSGNQTLEQKVVKKPSLLVLPFESLSDSNDGELLADGICDELTYALSRSGFISVVSRQSAYGLKNQALNLASMSKELGMRYALTGKLRSSRKKLRIYIQLINATDGQEIWAERFDGKMGDIFALQDRITAKVAAALGTKIRMAEIAAARRRSPSSIDAYTLFLRALPLVHSMREPNYIEAQRLLQAAFEIDDDYGLAKALYGWCCTLQIPQGWGSVDNAEAEGALRAREAIATGYDQAEVLCYGGYSLGYLLRDEEEGIGILGEAIKLDPNSSQNWTFLGWMRLYGGNLEEARESFEEAIGLAPLDPFAYRTHAGLAFANFFLGNADSAIGWGRRALRENPNFSVTHRALAAALVEAGNLNEAKAVVQALRDLVPSLTVAEFAKASRFRGEHDRDRLFAGLESAGLPSQ